MAIDDIYRLSVQWEQRATLDDAVNVFHFKQLNATVFDTPGEDLVQAFQGEAEERYTALVTDLYAIKRYSVRKIGGVDEEYDLGVNVEGTLGAGTGMLPAQVAAIISWRTGLAGRSHRGRTYLPPANESSIASGVYESSYLIVMGQFASLVLGMASHIGVAYGQYQVGVYSPTLEEFFPYTTFLARQTPGIVRRRRIGSGS